MAEFSRSLATADPQLARQRCLRATAWFRSTVETLSLMPAPTRSDLENAARGFFLSLSAELDQPRELHPTYVDEEIALNLELSRERLSDLDAQLVQNQFDPKVENGAERLLDGIGLTLGSVPPTERMMALQLAARAEREVHERLIHLLTKPAASFVHRDDLFTAQQPLPIINTTAKQKHVGAAISVKVAAEAYLAQKLLEGVGQSQRTELERALGWLQEFAGADRQLHEISKAELRTLRNDIGRLKVLRGRKLPFKARLTNDPEKQIKSATSTRYWRSIQGFFAWAEEQEYITENFAAGLKLAMKKGEEKQSPDPFTTDELQQLFQSPLYAGYLSRTRVAVSGNCKVRDGRWWSGVLLLFTGLRAGELAQLLPGDFDFHAPIPHLKVRREDETGKKVKSIKTPSSLRDVPLAPTLLTLGLQAFVEKRAKAGPNKRVFAEFRLGTNGRKSDGVTKFWGSYLRQSGLWKPGRSTHVWRHTVIACLRANDVAEEDIQAFVGHSRQTVTAGYGGAYPLARKLKTAERLDYGFDIVSLLEGDKVVNG